MRHYRFEETCPACPQQYDVWDGDTKVAYVRYRWGYLRVNPYTKEKFMGTDYFGNEIEKQKIDFETVIFGMNIGNGLDGSLPSNKEEAILDRIDREIQRYFGE